MLRVVAVLIACLPVLLLACGGDDGGDEPTPSGPPLSDLDYVQALCTGIKNYVDVAYTKSEGEIRDALDGFVRDMKAVNPPGDVRAYHSAFVRYLEGEREHPTNLLAKPPPLPESPLRARLAMAEQQAACVAPLFTRE